MGQLYKQSPRRVRSADVGIRQDKNAGTIFRLIRVDLPNVQVLNTKTNRTKIIRCGTLLRDFTLVKVGDV